MRAKDLWFKLYEKKLYELEDEGLDPALAHEAASEYAFTAQREAMEDAADAAYERMKEERK